MLIHAACYAIVALVGLGLLALGLASVTMALRALAHDASTWWQQRHSKNWQTTPGSVTRSFVTQLTGGGRMPTFAARIAYTYTVAGQHFTSTRVQFDAWWYANIGGRVRANAMVARWPKGAPVTVYFDPVQPASAALDRAPPRLGLTLFFALLLLPVGAGLICLGIDVLVGAWQAPPPFAPDETPPLRHQLGWLLVGLGVLALPIARLVARRGRSARDLLARLQTAAPAPIGALERGQDVAVFGRVAATAGSLASPLTRAPLVYYRARLLGCGEMVTEAVGRCEFQIEDETGSVLVSPAGGTVVVPARSLPIDTAAQDWIDTELARTPTPAREPFAVELARLAVGEPVLVVGTASRDGALRRLCLRARPDQPYSLVVATEPLPVWTRRLSRRAGRGRALAMAAVVALLAGAAMLAG